MRNFAIERTNAVDHDQDILVKKLLLLGAGESGKSTLFKQTIDLYGSGFTEKEITDYVQIVYTNTINSMQVLCREVDRLYQMEKVEECKLMPQNIPHQRYILEYSSESDLTPECAASIKALWADPGIKTAFDLRSKFQLLDSAEYFFEKVDSYAKKDFRPSKQDILRVRVRTTGILDTTFKLEDLRFKIFDVGGQRNERKKWIHCFENVTAVIFVAAISEYDQVLFEDDVTNRITEALNLFEETINSRWFVDTAIILFLNKKDLFEEKLKRVALKTYFPDFVGKNEFEEGWRYFAKKFTDKSADPNKQIYTHVTCATEDQNVQIVFNSVKDIVVRKGLIRSGLL